MTITIGVVLVVVLMLALGLYRSISAETKKVKEEMDSSKLLMLVKGAEMIYGAGKGDAKRRYVREQMKQLGLSSLSRVAVEAAVYELKKNG